MFEPIHWCTIRNGVRAQFLLDQLPRLKGDTAVWVLVKELRVMSREDDGGPLLMELAENLHDVRGHLRIQVPGRFVKK